MTYVDALRHHVERSLRHCLEGEPLERDVDGDYLVPIEAFVVRVSPMVGHAPPLVRVWSTVLTEVKVSRALLTELNDVNLGLRQLRCVLDGDAVLLSAELEIESLEPAALWRLVQHVGSAADHVGTLIATVHGGEIQSVIAKRTQESENS